MYEYILYAANIGHSFTDAALRGILRSAIVDYDTDVFAPHLKGVPTLVRMGGNDTNVTPWNLRSVSWARRICTRSSSYYFLLMDGADGLPGSSPSTMPIQPRVRIYARLGFLATYQSPTSTHVPPFPVPVNEVPGQPHWWGGVVDDAFMQSYIDSHMYTDKAALPATFTVVANGLWGTGRGGVKVLQQLVTRRLSTVSVSLQQGSAITLKLSTRNVRRFGFTRTDLLLGARRWSRSGSGMGTTAAASGITNLVIDGQAFSMDAIPTLDAGHFCRVTSAAEPSRSARGTPQSVWQLCSGSDWAAMERSEQSYGPVRQVLNGPLAVVFAARSADSQRLAVGVANQLMVQTHAAVRVVRDADAVALSTSDPAWLTSSNFVIVGAPTSNDFLRVLMGGSSSLSASSLRAPPTPLLSLARTMQFEPTNFSLDGVVFAEPGTGVLAFGALLPQQRIPMTGRGIDAYATPTGGLVAVAAGVDSDGVAAAVALFPRLSNMEVPDFVVLDAKRSRWQGAGGFLAAGFWDHGWGVELAMSYL